jgi:hypothetical protein
MSEARSTLLVSSLAVVRANGHFGRYAAALTRDQLELLTQMVAGSWVGIDLAIAHYRACDSLGLSHDEMATFGRSVFDKTRGTLLGTMVRMAREAGANPWTVLPHLQRFWNRGYRGGGIRVLKTGPKDAIADVIETPLLETAYYRYALRGLLSAVLELFTRKVYVTLERGRERSATFRMQWV